MDPHPHVRIKRVYDAPSPDDGYRVLADRLWPRGIRKQDLMMDCWAKDAAPLPELRKAWHSGRMTDQQFYNAYAAQLDGDPAVTALAHKALTGPVTLLIAGRNMETTHARVLAQAITQAMNNNA